MIRHLDLSAGSPGGRATTAVIAVATILVIGGVFAAGLGLLGLPLRYPLALLLALITVLVLLQGPATAGRRTLLVAVPVWTGAVAVYCAILSPLAPSDNDTLFRYALLYPLGALTGAVMASSRHRPWLGRAFVGWATVFAVLAVVEFVFFVHLVPGPGHPGLVRDGLLRAVVAAEHPLVLAALLAMALPFLWALPLGLPVRVVVSAVLVSGILATGSRGALVLVVLAAVIALVVHRWPATRRGRALVRVAVAVGVATAAVVALAAAGFTSWNVLTSDDPETASLQYRVVLYQKVIESLGTHPFGWGLGGLPAGIFVVPSPFGDLDLSTTIDSEVALIAFDAGIIGVVAFAALVGYLVSRWVLASDAGQAAFVAVVAGGYVAIHAWTGLGLAVALVLGAALAADRVRSTDRTDASADPNP